MLSTSISLHQCRYLYARFAPNKGSYSLYLEAEAILDHSRVLFVGLARSRRNLFENKIFPDQFLALDFLLRQAQDLFKVLHYRHFIHSVEKTDLIFSLECRPIN